MSKSIAAHDAKGIDLHCKRVIEVGDRKFVFYHVINMDKEKGCAGKREREKLPQLRPVKKRTRFLFLSKIIPRDKKLILLSLCL